MNPLQLFLLAAAVLDQRDGPGILVELDDGSALELDRRCVPPWSKEGDHLRLVRSTRRCPHRFRAVPDFNRLGGDSRHINGVKK